MKAQIKIFVIKLIYVKFFTLKTFRKRATVYFVLPQRPPPIKEVQTLLSPAASSPIYDARRKNRVAQIDRQTSSAVQCSGRCRGRWCRPDRRLQTTAFARASGVRVRRDFFRSLARSLALPSLLFIAACARVLSRRSRNCDDGRTEAENRLVRYLCVPVVFLRPSG